MKQELIDELIRLALKEDLGDGDHTTLSTIPASARGKVQLLIKESGVLAGVAVAQQIFRTFDPELTVTVLLGDGSEVKYGDIAFTVEGKVQSLLQIERLVLNVMQRMSGIATTTRRYVRQLEGTRTRVLDTRKTTPGLRMLEKEAVRIGGGCNHRIGLFDMILLKDNHVDFAGGIENAIVRAKDYLRKKGKQLPIELEVRNFDELSEALRVGGIDRIMLDNFSISDTQKAVEQVHGAYPLESSGGITFDTLRAYAETGVDFISVGALTHSVKSLDMSLKAMGGELKDKSEKLKVGAGAVGRCRLA
jgi:nicotinate-nucleotide pyrophosphorylase (carboxylating)